MPNDVDQWLDQEIKNLKEATGPRSYVKQHLQDLRKLPESKRAAAVELLTKIALEEKEKVQEKKQKLNQQISDHIEIEHLVDFLPEEIKKRKITRAEWEIELKETLHEIEVQQVVLNSLQKIQEQISPQSRGTTPQSSQGATPKSSRSTTPDAVGKKLAEPVVRHLSLLEQGVEPGPNDDQSLYHIKRPVVVQPSQQNLTLTKQGVAPVHIRSGGDANNLADNLVRISGDASQPRVYTPASQQKKPVAWPTTWKR